MPKGLGLTGAILAGGASSRMGRDKAELEVLPPSGERLTMIQLVSWSLARVCDEVLVVGGPERRGIAARPTPDLMPGSGVLGGLYSALSAATNELVFLVACDMPYLDAAVVEKLAQLAEGHDAVVPEIDGQFEPLHAVYRRSCVQPIKAALHRGERRMISFFPAVKLRAVGDLEYSTLDPSLRSLANLNTPEEFQRAVEGGLFAKA